MPYKIVKREFQVDVKDELPVDNVNNPDMPQFVPDHANVQIEDGAISVLVSGPLFNAAGRLLKTKRGVASFDEQDIRALEAPIWVLNLVNEVTGGSSLVTDAAVVEGIAQELRDAWSSGLDMDKIADAAWKRALRKIRNED